MNAKQFRKLIIVLLLVGGVGGWISFQQQKAWKQSESALGGKVIPDFQLNDVASIVLKDAENELTVAKQDAIWTVNERWHYPADFSKISGLLQDVWDLKIAQRLEAGPKQYGRFRLLPPGEGENSGTLLTFNGKDKSKIAELLLGKPHDPVSPSSSQFGGGFSNSRYVLPGGEGKAVFLVSETFSTIETDAKSWLNKDFFKVEKLQAIEVVHPEEADSWAVSRDTDSADMTLAGLAEDEELDSAKTYSLKNLLSSPSFNDVADPAASADNTETNQPILATLKTFDRFEYTVKIGQPNDDDNYPLTLSVSAEIPTKREVPEDESEEDKERLDKEFKEKNEALKKKLETEQAYQKWTYLVSKWTIDTLLNKRSDLIKKKEETEAESLPPPLPDISVDSEESVESEKKPEPPAEESEPGKANNVEALIDEITNPLPAPNP